MPTNIASRVINILIVLIVALISVFGVSASRWFDHNLSFIQRTNLHPGIDMVGGVSLVYQIQATSGTNDPNLANEVMVALKRRVDPDGLKNLVWRPEGNTRLEIQMPLSPEAAQAPNIKQNFNTALQALDATNVRQDQVLSAVEQLTAAARDSRLAMLAADSPARKTLFTQLAAAWDNFQALSQKINQSASPDAATIAAARDAQDTYQSLQSRIESTDLQSASFQQVLEEANSDNPDKAKAGQSKIDDLKKQYADFPSRLKAMDAVSGQFKDYLSVQNAITGSEDLKRLLQGSGVLEFHILADSITSNPADLKAMDQRLQPNGSGPLSQPGDKIQWMEVDKVEEFQQGGRDETREWNGKHYVPVLVSHDASMTKSSGNWGLNHAYRTSEDGIHAAVGFEFNNVGAGLFGDLTRHWHDLASQRGPQSESRLAIVLDGKVISAPNIQNPITGGSGVITGGGQGGFNAQELDYLINTLNAGSLPAQLSSQPISEQNVGPTLGADNLNKGLIACGFGLVVVGIFLVTYYYLAGAVAFIAVCFNVLIILGVMAGLGATFTLPSIAGIVLTIGTAVDANVLIFERLREEQHKGLPLRLALRNSYSRAQSAIIDSNMTSVITSLCLYAFGSEEVKGFGATLLIGICASLFTALYVTKTVFAILIDRFNVKNLGSFPLSFPKWDKALKPDWDWMGKAWIFYTFSIISISIGLILFFVKVHDGKMMGIEFASGTDVQFALKQPMSQEDVRKLVDAESEKNATSLPSPTVVMVGTDQKHYEVVTPNIDRRPVELAVLDALGDKLDVQISSTFDQVDADYNTAVHANSVLPVANASFSTDGFVPSAAADHVGGVAIVLRNLNPQLSPAQIRNRMDNVRQNVSSNISGSVAYTVSAPTGDTQPSSFVVITAWNPTVSYGVDQGKWADGLAEPMWQLTKSAVHSPPSFEQETNFDPQVAGKMQQDAFLALFCSIAAIMVYIWVRFGNMKYGTATVIALLHDTIFTLAALGFAHYFYDLWHNNPLEIGPFRIDLTVVAGILTIMSYSMIDTIVVFDRIRENRGRYGHLDRKVVNDAINQTLSRTLLTAGTSIITVSFMYFLGGEGIHAFTFVLLVGILVGTYSSVAIAAPLLLRGGDTTAPKGVARGSEQFQDVST